MSWRLHKHSLYGFTGFDNKIEEEWERTTEAGKRDRERGAGWTSRVRRRRRDVSANTHGPIP